MKKIELNTMCAINGGSCGWLDGVIWSLSVVNGTAFLVTSIWAFGYDCA